MNILHVILVGTAAIYLCLYSSDHHPFQSGPNLELMASSNVEPQAIKDRQTCPK